MPWYDWQFWIVSAFALGGAWVLIRPFLRSRFGKNEDSRCPNCASGAAASKPKRRVALTIERRQL
jgi:hypothetical protein